MQKADGWFYLSNDSSIMNIAIHSIYGNENVYYLYIRINRQRLPRYITKRPIYLSGYVFIPCKSCLEELLSFISLVMYGRLSLNSAKSAINSGTN